MNHDHVLILMAVAGIAWTGAACGTEEGGSFVTDADAVENEGFDGADDALADGDGQPDTNPDGPIVCEGNCHYVREGASGRGDGSDWDNAWTALPETLQRGHVYFIAGGHYPVYEFDDPESGSEVVTIMKATASNPACTDAAGWNDGYGDAAAVMPAVGFSTGYYVFDGAVGTGESGYGFDIYDENPPDRIASLVVFNQDVSHVVVSRTAMHRPTMDHRGTGVYATLGGNSDITFSRCYIHDLYGVHFYLVDASNITIESSIMERNQSTAELYTESIQAGNVSGLVVRTCWFEDIRGTGVIVNESGDSAGWEIYGNVFNGYDSSRGVVADTTGSSITGAKVYNNTMLDATIFGGIRFGGGAGGNAVNNNLFFNCAMVVHEGVDYDYNYYTSCTFPYEFQPGLNEPPKDVSDTHSSINTDPFVSSGGGDFHLAAPLEGYPGMALDPPYDVDFDGNTRGQDGVWDRGAFEYDQ
jgi:hypothetical protein